MDMPLFDLPVDQLESYRGRNPRPADFDGYWERALDELDATDADVEIHRVDYPNDVADAYDLWFTGTGGARIYAKYLRSRREGASASGVAQFHGYSMSSVDWFDLLPWAAQGHSVLAMDCRGQGGRSQDVGGVPGNTLQGHIIRGLDGDPEDLLYRHIFLDTVQAVRVFAQMPEINPDKLAAVGGSQGGGLALACAALSPQISAVASVYPFLSDYQRVWELELGDNAYAELRQYLRRFDPTHQRFNETFTRLGYIDVHHLAARITAPTLMITGLSDQVCPPSTQFAAYNNIPAPKEYVLYPDYGHEGLPGADDRIVAFFRSIFGR